MNTISKTEEVKNAIEQSKGILVYFYNDACAPCIALRPKVENMLKEEFSKMNSLLINAAQYPELAASYNVFASPTILVFFEGVEYFRVSKYISVPEMAVRIDRYYSLLFG